MNNKELLGLLELIHSSVNCLCVGFMSECNLKKKIRELQIYIWQRQRDDIDNKNSN